MQVDNLKEVSEYFEKKGCFDELISLMESGIDLEYAHVGIFTELGTLNAKYHLEKLIEYLKFFATRINIPKLIRICNRQQHWKKFIYLYIQYDEFDNVTTTMISHSSKAWNYMQFKDVAI